MVTLGEIPTEASHPTLHRESATRVRFSPLPVPIIWALSLNLTTLKFRFIELFSEFGFIEAQSLNLKQKGRDLGAYVAVYRRQI